jgi:hypothetical protein
MKINLRIWTRAALALAFLVTAACTQSVRGQETLTGTWTGSLGEDKTAKHGKKLEQSDEPADAADWQRQGGKSDGIHLSLERRTERGGRNQMGQTYDFSELQGLTREQAQGTGPVRFALVREAGRVDLEGSFQNGRGSGTFTFTPNGSFLGAMKSRGFDFETVSVRDNHRGEPGEKLFAAAMLNVTTALADDLLSADFGQLDVDDLFKAAIFKVDSKFMREMKASGYPLRMEELVKARIFKIDADFLREAARYGFDKEPFEHIVKMRIFKVTPQFINEVRAEGLNDLAIEDLVKLRIFNIDAEFIRRARAEGVPMEVEALVQERIGVGRRRRARAQ